MPAMWVMRLTLTFLVCIVVSLDRLKSKLSKAQFHCPFILEWDHGHGYFLGKKLDYLQLNNFLKYKCELYLKQPLTPSQRKIVDLP